MHIDKSEALRYLGYRGQEYDENIDKKLDKAIELCLAKIRPRHIVQKYALQKQGELSLAGTDVVFQGKSIAEHLEDCNEAYIMGATVGFELDRLVAILMCDDPLMGILVDTCGSCAIESYCDDICEELQKNSEKQLTWRFSCGYGDFPISQQLDFARLLKMEKNIGVYTDMNTFMMSPQKSVTAVIGIKESNRKSKGTCKSKCANCGNVNCPYRKV